MIDDQVGRILDALERAGQLDQTVIVFTADHGDMAGGHGMVWKSNGSFYDEIVRVPLADPLSPAGQTPGSSLAVRPDRPDADAARSSPANRSPPGQGQSLVPFLTGQSRHVGGPALQLLRAHAADARPHSRKRGTEERILHGPRAGMEIHPLPR